MKILHTSDWHLGHLLYNYDRTEEQQTMLRQMVDIVRDEKPDLFLLCGDVYHTPQPSAAVQTMFADTLVALHDANPSMALVITAGNHDSGSRHEIFRTPWKALNVHTLGTLDKETPESHIIHLQGKGYVVAVPYSNERNMPDDFFQTLLDTVNERNSDNLPVVMTAHTTVNGCDFTGHDNSSEHIVGGIDGLDIKQLGDGYDYLALGHIHHAQYVHTGKHNVRYSGSPIAVSFDENYSHSISMVTIEHHGDTPDVRTIDIANPRPLVTLPTEGLTTWDNAKALLRDFPSDIPAYIRLNVEVEGYLPVEANAEANTLTTNKACRFCLINAKRKAQATQQAKELTVQEFTHEEPIDIAIRYAEDTGFPFTDELQSLFKETVMLVNEDSRNE